MERFPDFFIVGAAKSGTTALWKYLGTISGIYMTKDISDKELGYFSDSYGISDRNHYLSFFRTAKENEIIGESCHAYLTSHESAERIKGEVKNAKIIISLRNPVKRAFSLYSWMVMHGYEDSKTFEEAIRMEGIRMSDEKFLRKPPHSFIKNFEYFSTGMYHEQVKRYYDVFGEENVRVLIFEEFIKPENKNIVIDLVKFLGINTDKIPVFEKVNESFRVIDVAKQFYLKQELINKYRRNFFLKIFADYIVKIRMNRNIDRKRKFEILPETYTSLMELYQGDINKLSSLLKKDLNLYWTKQ